MEIVLSIIGMIIFIWVVNIVISAGARTVGAAAKSVLGDGTFTENMNQAFQTMPLFEVKLRDNNVDQNDSNSPLLKEIVGKGIFPLVRPTKIGFFTSVFDNTGPDLEPVISFMEEFQEEDNMIYQHRLEVGEVNPDQGFVDWVRLGVVITDLIQPPYGGCRQLLVIIRMVDMDNMPGITLGFHNDHPGLLWQASLDFSHTFTEKGYTEVAEHRDEAMGIALKIGMAVAMADGALDESEGEILKAWIIQTIKPFSDEKKANLKQIYNSAMKEAYHEAKTGDLSLSALTGRLNEIGEKATRYRTIELCFDVMAADGIADVEEIKTIRKIASALNLDYEEIEKMRDQKIINLDSRVSSQVGIEELLGIGPDWSAGQIKKHLRVEFQKWNNRLNTLPEGNERDNAQRMINLIAEARKKYN